MFYMFNFNISLWLSSQFYIAAILQRNYNESYHRLNVRHIKRVPTVSSCVPRWMSHRKFRNYITMFAMLSRRLKCERRRRIEDVDRHSHTWDNFEQMRCEKRFTGRKKEREKRVIIYCCEKLFWLHARFNYRRTILEFLTQCIGDSTITWFTCYVGNKIYFCLLLIFTRKTCDGFLIFFRRIDFVYTFISLKYVS